NPRILHLLRSLHIVFEYIEVTEAVGSERDCVHPERFKNCLIIADRGYISEDLEKRITDSGNLFLIRGKANTAGVITECFDDNGQNITKYIGKTVKTVPEQTGADLSVVSKLTDHKLRVVLRHNQNAKADEQRSVLRTNIPRECLCAKQIFMLYRVRWSIELFNKANKRSNCLQSINSADKNIILTFVLLSLIASLSKTYCGIKAMLKKNIQWISMLKLHKLNTAFSNLFRSLQSLNLSSIYQIFKELFDEISMHCQRTTPSNRDRVLLKDLPLLVWQIVNQPNPFDKNVLRS
ncbi:MAG: transposase, partial [Succinivibrio sp.]|nr:transposase [Succinivibrio sp.]